MKLCILDRDGTINEDRDDFVKSALEWQPLPGALEAIARINHAGWHVVVASNQSGLGRGLFDVVALNAIHAKMLRQVAAVGGRIDAVFYCPHAPDEACHCRTPAPGLLEQICDRYGVEPFDARVVGSCAEHLQAGAALKYVGVAAVTFDAAVPAVVGLVAVAVVLAVRLVVLGRVADEVAQREAVVRGDEAPARVALNAVVGSISLLVHAERTLA